jgi:hypothetical membrane protein
MRAAQRLGWAGPAAAALFAVSLIGFAAIRTDGYTHATKAVSELGAVDAPNALGFNLLGFVLPGLLVAVLAGALRAALKSWAGPLLLGISGLFFLGAGVFPVDMTARNSALSVAHLAMAQLSGVAFAIAVFPLGSAMRRHPHFAALGRVTPWFLLFLLANIAWQVVWQATGSILPGWGQRIAFGGYFAWAALAGYQLTRLNRA